MEPFEKHINIIEANQTAVSILFNHCPSISKQKLKQAMQYGAAWLTHSNKVTRIRRAKKVLLVGDELHLYYNEKTLFSDVKPAKLIAYEGEYSVWDKPSGMFSQGTKWADHSSIARWVELFGLKQNGLEQKPSFLVHRLDRATSGLIIVAHSKNATKQLTQLFEKRQIKKHYFATVEGEFPLELILKELNDNIDGKQALTIVLSSSFNVNSNQSHLLVEIKTGRKHQIRKHLLALGFPIVGDRLYGDIENKNSNEMHLNNTLQKDLNLQSCYLEFKSPFDQTEKKYSIELSLL